MLAFLQLKKKERKWDTSYDVPSLKKYSKVYVINVFMEVIYAKYLEQCLGLDKQYVARWVSFISLPTLEW